MTLVYSGSSRVSLAPRLPHTDVEQASYFHRGLSLWNETHGRACLVEELTKEELEQVNQIALAIQRREHPLAQEPAP